MELGKRVRVAMLVLSAAGLSMTALQEGYTPKATIPVPGDPPTYGLGSTTTETGQPVKINDTITVPRAIRLAVRDIGAKEKVMRACLGDDAELFQWEWDAYVDLSYNVGSAAFCASSIPKKIQAHQYEVACKTISDFRYVRGRDCSLAQNKGFCGGIWTRRQQMTALCLSGVRP